MSLTVGVPPSVLKLVQEGLLERAFHDGLFPKLQYRAEAQKEQWTANTGTEIFMSRPGLLAPIVEPQAAGTDPLPQAISYEQWVARLALYTGTLDIHMPTSVVANSNLFLRSIHQLGLQAGQSLNQIPRNTLFKAYGSGHTVMIAAGLAGDTSIRVAALNGFTEVVSTGTNVRPVPVSSSNPLVVSITGVTGTRNVIGYTPDDADDPFGPGTLLLSAALGAGVASRSPVLSANRPRIIRSGGGTSVDAIGAADTFVLQDAINATNRLRANNVQPHEDGFYHGHISPEVQGQVFTDPAFQRLNTALPDHSYYQEGFIGTIGGIAFFLNNETPKFDNSGARTATSASAFYSKAIGMETTNNTGVNIGRTIITGRGCLTEMYLDESNYVSEAGVTGKIGEFTVVNAGMEVTTENIRLILRAPIDRLQHYVAATWSITTSFAVPSDISSGGSELFKRAVIIESAID